MEKINILISPNIDKENFFTAFDSVYRQLMSMNAGVIINEKYSDYFKGYDGIMFLPRAQGYSRCDYVLAIGGDGTILRAAKYAAVNGKPVLGVNTGRLGFMAAIEPNETSALSSLFTGQYFVEERMLLSVTVNDEQAPLYALNDAVISRGSSSRILDFDVALNGRHIVTYFADGVIVSTPTGSTAYSLSAGGPVVDPHMNCLIITPICPHSLFSRSIVLHEGSSVRVFTKPGATDPPFLAVDGEPGRQLRHGDAVKIEKAGLSARFIRFKPNEFYDVLNEKLMYRRS